MFLNYVSGARTQVFLFAGGGISHHLGRGGRVDREKGIENGDSD